MWCVYIIISLISLASIAWVSFSIPKTVQHHSHCWFSLLLGIVFDTYVCVGHPPICRVLFSVPIIVRTHSLRHHPYCWVSFSIPMLACNAPLWSGCLSLLPGIVFDTHHPEPAPLHYAGIVFNTYGYLMTSSSCRVLFSILWLYGGDTCIDSFPIAGYCFRYLSICVSSLSSITQVSKTIPMRKRITIVVFRRVLYRVSV